MQTSSLDLALMDRVYPKQFKARNDSRGENNGDWNEASSWISCGSSSLIATIARYSSSLTMKSVANFWFAINLHLSIFDVNSTLTGNLYKELCIFNLSLYLRFLHFTSRFQFFS